MRTLAFCVLIKTSVVLKTLPDFFKYCLLFHTMNFRFNTFTLSYCFTLYVYYYCNYYKVRFLLPCTLSEQAVRVEFKLD